ncbi:MAG: glycosyltransferase family 4 protein [Chloroflexi bacterium]|nr:glycosyltransferase family 4 protein [Chloroflexota bacterium]
MKPLRLLHICAVYPPFVGGASTYVAEISRRFAAQGHSVTVLTTDIAQIDATWSPHARRIPVLRENLDGVQVERMRIGHLPGAPFSFYALRRLMPLIAPIAPRTLLRAMGRCVPLLVDTQRVRTLLRQPYDLTHIVNITMESPLLAAASVPGPRVCTPFVHIGSDHVLRNYVMPHQMQLLHDSQRVLVQTPREGAALAQLGVNQNSLRLLGMGMNPREAEESDGAEFRRRHGLPPSVPIIAFLGSITRDKGAVPLLEAMQLLWQENNEAVVALAGEIPAPGGFAHAIQQLPEKWRCKVVLPGVLRGREKHDMLAAASVFAMPSRVDSFGIAYLEAWAHGLPVIGADAGGVPDVITHEQDGYILPFGDAQNLAEHIQMLLANPELAATLGNAGKRKMLDQYTWESIFTKVERQYEELT